MEEFYQILNSKIEEKQNQYDALMQNLSSSALPVSYTHLLIHLAPPCISDLNNIYLLKVTFSNTP